ncbi:MAG: FAD-dependent oxidoreductase [Acidobacteriota bacterium]
MTASAYDVAIVGAGIVGAACAEECSREGLSVLVIESNVVGGGATAAGMGHIVVMDDSEAQFALTKYSQDLWREIAADLPISTEYDECGTIWVAADDEEMEEVHRKRVFYEERGVTAEVLDAKALAEAEPNLRRNLAGGLRVPADAVTYSPAVARFLLERAKVRGTVVHCDHAVVDISGGRLLLDDGTHFSAKVTINATGSSSPILTPGIDVQKRKGHLVITDRYPGFVQHQLVELGYLKSAHSLTTDSVAFNVQPRRTGQLLIGSSRQYGSETTTIDQPMLSRMLSRAAEYMPQLCNLNVIRTWTGFRAATADKLPLVGPCPDREGVFLATGHEGLGITTSLGTARLIADQLLNRPSAIPIEPYLPSREKQESAHG